MHETDQVTNVTNPDSRKTNNIENDGENGTNATTQNPSPNTNVTNADVIRHSTKEKSRSAPHVEDIGSEDENEDAIENSSQRKAIRNPDLQFEILNEVVDACEDDYLNQFFNEFGDLINTNEDVNLMQLASQDQNTPPEVEESTQNVKPFETIPYIPSKEGSDVEFIPDPISSGEDYKDIPEEFKPEEWPKGMKYTKTMINRYRYIATDIEKVEKLPWDVDGEHCFQMKCTKDQWVDKSKDGWWFNMHTSSRKGFHGKQKMGQCIGSLLCLNPQCPKLRMEGICNSNPQEFGQEKIGRVCKCCGYYTKHFHCGALKNTEYDYETGTLTVWYEGKHNCIVKPDLETKENFLWNLPLDETLRATPRELKIDLIKMYLAEDNINKAVEISRLMDDNTIIEKMRYMTAAPLPTPLNEDIFEAFKNISTLKKTTDKKDKYLIYAMNCKEINGGESYVFKTSAHHLRTAYKMDPTKKTVRGKVSLQAHEKAYFDAMHKRCQGYKMMTLWTHHPALRKMQRLATMEVERETKENVALFFKLFNEALSTYVGDPNYKFNPCFIMTDEAGANVQGLHEVFGEEFLERIATCQWHFEECACRQLKNVKQHQWKSYMKWVKKILGAHTVDEYKKYSKALEDICRDNNIVHWYNWWKVQRYHLVPALRGYGWTGTNWAEIGQSTMKRHRCVWLIYATWEDVCTSIIEENDYINFINNRGKKHWKRTNTTSACFERKENATTIHRVCSRSTRNRKYPR